MDDETAQAGRVLLFSFACLPVGGLLLWGSWIGNPYLSLAGVAMVLLVEFIWVALGGTLLWKLARLIWGGYRAGRLKSLSKDKRCDIAA